MAFKFLHAADLHLDSPLHKLESYEGAPVEEIRLATRRACENMVRLAVEEKVSFVLIAGDLYDGDWKDYNTGLYLVSQLNRLQDAGISVYVLAGNHDAESKITRALRLPQNVHLFSAASPSTFRLEGLDVAVHGQSFATPAIHKDLSLEYPKPLSGCFNIGVLHTCATGRIGHEPYAPCTLDGLRAKGYDYWALGHVHRHEVLSEDPPVVFSGNTQGRHARETGPKGCVLVTVEEGGRPVMERKPLDVIRWVRVDVDATGAQSGYDVLDRFGDRLKILLSENDGMPLAVRVHIQGEAKAAGDFFSHSERWTNEIRSAALEAGSGRVWVEKIRFTTAITASCRMPQATEGAVGELLSILDQFSADPDARSELAADLADLLKKLPRELLEDSDGMGLGDSDRIGDLLREVRPMLLERLLGKGGSE